MDPSPKMATDLYYRKWIHYLLLLTKTLLSALQCKNELRELCSVFGYESQLEDLERTVSTIKAVLLDAQSNNVELSNAGRVWIEDLKDAVYDVDDLLDEFATVAEIHQKTKGGKMSKKVRHFFSRYNKWLLAFNASHDIEKMREKLDKIARDRTQFGFSDVYVPVKRREETCSYVYEQSIIGRDTDKEAIIGMLTRESESSGHPHDYDYDDPISFVTIVGLGGLGKTALAQLVYKDDVIQRMFDLTMWVCVSEEFGMREILAKMLNSTTQECSGLGMEQLQRKVRELIGGKRYLLVLDDVWNDRHHEWLELKDFLIQGESGSRIVVTTRSIEVANAVGPYPVYKLQGLSEEDSWRLFERIAFKQGKERIDSELVEIGKEVVKKCANVPLSIRVVGSLLYGQDKSKWLSFRRTDLAKVAGAKDEVMSILKFSYYHLSPSSKSCFSFCALFPKDYAIHKSTLIRLWLAQGCLEQPVDDRSVEDVGEDQFKILLQRCFFQDIIKDEYGEVSAFKLHDLIHDLAREVAGKEYSVSDSTTIQFSRNIRHLSVANCGSRTIMLSPNCLGDLKALRTCLKLYGFSSLSDKDVTTMLSRSNLLRVLDLSSTSLKVLPDTIGKLLHLRYLNLSWSGNLECLPKSVTNLHNLQVLNLHWCTNLKKLPDDLRKLVNLRYLDIRNCDRLTYMPAGMNQMTNLQELTTFVAGGPSSTQNRIGHLRDLQALVNLKGRLRIKLKCDFPYDATEVTYLLRELHLKSLNIGWEQDSTKRVADETVLPCLQPHCDLRELGINGYGGVRLTSWMMQLVKFLPCIVSISLGQCTWLKYLPSLSQLPHLKNLDISDMDRLEFIEGGNGDASFSGTTPTFFPSLEQLDLDNLPSLKGWWEHESGWKAGEPQEGSVDDHISMVPLFTRLHKLAIKGCPWMASFPSCPFVKKVSLKNINEALTLYRRQTVSSCSDHKVLHFERITIDAVGLLNSLFDESIGGIHQLKINGFEQESLSVVSEGYERHASSIRNLRIESCRALRSLSTGGLEHLTNLQSLEIYDCMNLDLAEDGEDGITMIRLWKSLQSLSSLKFFKFPKLLTLPEGIKYLTSLTGLEISSCDNLEELPEWLHCLGSLQWFYIHNCPKLIALPEAMRHLTSLRRLSIIGCEGLLERCKEPDGEDCLKIRHIPNLKIILR